MRILCGLGIVAAVVGGNTAMAQTAAAVRGACDTYLTPASAKPSKNAPRGVTVDCGCISDYLVGHYGAPDAQVIVRLFAAAGGGSEADLKAVVQEIGADRVKGVIGKVGTFKDLGRRMNQTCPEVKNP
jgi:hypothetical protein